MSYYASKVQLYQWATAADGLRQFMRPEDYPRIWKQIESKRLGRVALGLLKVLLERRLRSVHGALSEAVKTREIADVLRCSSGHIADAANRINDLVVQGLRDRSEAPIGAGAGLAFMRDFGLVWRNQHGIGILPGLVDVSEAVRMSRSQIAGVTRTWENNVKIAREAEAKDGPMRDAAPTVDERNAFERLSPAQRRELLAMAARAESDADRDPR